MHENPLNPDLQDRLNRRVYCNKGVERSYSRADLLTRAEAMTLLKYQAAFAGRDVLDVGVGTGRTTAYLAPLARRYEGIDYSPVMIEYFRHTLPDVAAQLGDMRDLSMFESGSFDMVFASNCVIDAVSHEDRLRTLSEVWRVLRPQGFLIFSSHNRSYDKAFDGPRPHVSRNPGTALRNLFVWGRQLVHHAQTARFRRVEPEYALLTDEGHDFACLHYYVEASVQQRQLANLQFHVVDMLNHLGHSLAPADESRDSPWLMYVAQKVLPQSH
jgi:SAM-dependent methyltransferase